MLTFVFEMLLKTIAECLLHVGVGQQQSGTEHNWQKYDKQPMKILLPIRPW